MQNNIPDRFFNISKKELQVLEAFWRADKPLTASEIPLYNSELKHNTARVAIKDLLNIGLLEVTDISIKGTKLARTYKPTITSEDYAVGQLNYNLSKLNSKTTTAGIVACLLDSSSQNETAALKEIEDLIKERRKKLN